MRVGCELRLALEWTLNVYPVILCKGSGDSAYFEPPVTNQSIAFTLWLLGGYAPAL